MSKRTLFLVCVAMICFAANSLINRAALLSQSIDPVSFAFIRLLSGALFLTLLVCKSRPYQQGSWHAAFALFVYIAGFSLAYVSLTAATGALLLFAAVQVTMIGWGTFQGERLSRRQVAGLILACAGVSLLLLPNSSTPSTQSTLLMVIAGIAWGIYSILGKNSTNHLLSTAGNFIRAVPFAIVLPIIFHDTLSQSGLGVLLACLSGGLASGAGYALWYAILPHLPSSMSASVQLSVPPITAIGAVLFLDEPLTLILVLCTVVILLGIGLVIWGKAS